MHVLPAALAVAALVGALAAAPAAAQNRLALACIANHTSMQTVRFQYQFGNGEWQSASVDKGYWNRLRHWYSFDNENSGPQLRIRYDADLTSGTYWQNYDLPQYAVPTDDCNSYGKKYRFTESGNRLNLTHDN